MSGNPIEILGAKFPDLVKDIPRISNKWAKRTEKLSDPWPADGTFDPAACEVMEQRIKDYKPKDKGNKRSKKRQLELKILSHFKKEGEWFRTQFKDRLLNYKQMTNQASGIYPSLAGTVKINGDFDIVKHDVQAAGTQAQTQTQAYSPPPYTTDSTNQPTNSIDNIVTCDSDGRDTRAETPAKTFNNPRLPPDFCSTGKRPHILDCYKDHNTSGVRRSYWINLEPGADLHRELNRSQILELEGDIDRYHDRAAALTTTDQWPEVSQPEKTKTTDNPREREYDLRYRPAIHKPDRYQAGQFPILVKGASAHYIPWQTLDLTGLVARLPDIHEGASKWIRAFEEETVGKMLALGDIKAIWAQSFGTPAMEVLFKRCRHGWMLEPRADGTEFNAYRAELWAALRGEYPARVDPKALRGETLTDTENPAAYVTRQLKRWKQETEEEIESSPVLQTLFRNSVIEAMPPPVQTKLEEVVGLTAMPLQQFREHVVHAIEKHRRDEEKAKEADKNLQRKLTQLQLNELQGKGKKIMVVKTEENIPPTTQPETQPPQPPVAVNVYPEPRGLRGGPGNSYRPYRGMGRGTRRGGGECWACGMPGHFANTCTKNNANGRGRPTMRGSRGSGGPWGGPRFAY